MRVKNLENFPKEKVYNPNCAMPTAEECIGFNEARSIIGELTVPEELDEKEVWSCIMAFFVRNYENVIGTDTCANLVKIICQRFGTSAVGTGKQVDEATEMSLREFLWMVHGHTGQYGDDGEMQCQACCKYHCIDYKREPLDKVIETAIIALRDVNISKLSPSLSTKEVDEKELVEFLSEQCNCDMNLDCDRRELAKAISAFLGGER